ncbi:hypothetical protein PoB_005503000 [Plakobranchus ocellatus]|uniref:SMB domain-containing protein n=1 Tax=Plakobranchus ocellatus TaxID=259542 RepID=A0AAV4C741_9GAST|nr:hypothetical protein PoB_005503000 [Plakobranchus ocellatus]
MMNRGGRGDGKEDDDDDDDEMMMNCGGKGHGKEDDDDDDDDDGYWLTLLPPLSFSSYRLSFSFNPIKHICFLMATAQANIVIAGKLNIKLAMVFVNFVVLLMGILGLQEMSALGLSKPTIQDVEPTPSLTSTVTVPIDWTSGVRCEKLAVAVAHQKYLCKSQTASAYMELAKAQHTCEDRCGDTPIFRNDLLNCACDEICIVYGDCCRDISIVCPQIHGIGKARYADVMKKVTSSCHANNFAVLRESAHRCLSSTTPTADNAERRNQKLAAVKAMQRVSSNHLSSAASVFQSCTVHRVTDVASPLARNCKVYQIITCSCGDGTEFKEHVHNICMSQKFTAFSRYMFENSQLSRPLSRFGDADQCDVFNVTDSGMYHPLAALDLNKNGFKIKVTPIFPEPSGLFQENNNRSRDRDCDQQVQDPSRLAALDIVDREDVYYIVELEKTLEKRLHCPSLDMSLTDCRLEECVQGAIMFKAHFGHFGNHSCVLPALATVLVWGRNVTVPVCSCFRVLTALAALEIWKLYLSLSGGATCSFHLRALEKVATDLRNDPFEVEANNTGLAVETRFQKLYEEVSMNCSGQAETEENLQVCFYTAREMSQTQAKPALCFNASPQVRFLRRNSGKRTGDVSFLMLILVFIASFAWFLCLVF